MLITKARLDPEIKAGHRNFFMQKFLCDLSGCCALTALPRMENFVQEPLIELTDGSTEVTDTNYSSSMPDGVCINT